MSNIIKKCINTLLKIGLITKKIQTIHLLSNILRTIENNQLNPKLSICNQIYRISNFPAKLQAGTTLSLGHFIEHMACRKTGNKYKPEIRVLES